MTLILGLANQQQVILISDRRLSCNGKVVEDESNKAATFNLQDARLAVAFTGLASAGTFSAICTQGWPESTMPLWDRKEVQEMLWCNH